MDDDVSDDVDNVVLPDEILVQIALTDFKTYQIMHKSIPFIARLSLNNGFQQKVQSKLNRLKLTCVPNGDQIDCDFVTPNGTGKRFVYSRDNKCLSKMNLVKGKIEGECVDFYDCGKIWRIYSIKDSQYVGKFFSLDQNQNITMHIPDVSKYNRNQKVFFIVKKIVVLGCCISIVSAFGIWSYYKVASLLDSRQH